MEIVDELNTEYRTLESLFIKTKDLDEKRSIQNKLSHIQARIQRLLNMYDY